MSVPVQLSPEQLPKQFPQQSEQHVDSCLSLAFWGGFTMSDSWSEHEEFELVWDDVDLLEYEGGGCGLYSGNDSASDIVLVLERDEFVDDTDDAEEAISVGGKAKNTTSKKKKILKIGKRSDRTAFNSRNSVNIYNLFFFGVYPVLWVCLHIGGADEIFIINYEYMYMKQN